MSEYEDLDSTQLSQDCVSVSGSPVENVNRPKSKKKLFFTSDNASDIKKALKDNYHWLGCAAHHINLVIKAGFKNVKSAAMLLKHCKAIVKAVNHSNPIIYDVRKYQEELDLPPSKLMQEVTTRWWSILAMLESIHNNNDPITLALGKSDKRQLILSLTQFDRMKEIIELLKKFKIYTELFSKLDDVTITLIIPTFDMFKKLLKDKEGDSNMLKDMKKHMLQKLETRYTGEQMEYLSMCTYLDPRFKSSVNIDMQKFQQILKDIHDNSTEIILDTQSQTLNDIQPNPVFASPVNNQPATTSSSSNTMCEEDDIYEDDYNEEGTVRSSDDVATMISKELEQYAKIQYNKAQKKRYERYELVAGEKKRISFSI